MSAAPPVVEVTRRPGRLFSDAPVWIVQRCPYCARRHAHAADLVMRECVLPAKCSPAKFYLVKECAS